MSYVAITKDPGGYTLRSEIGYVSYVISLVAMSIGEMEQHMFDKCRERAQAGLGTEAEVVITAWGHEPNVLIGAVAATED